MDEDFAFFLENFGPAIEQHSVPEASIARYKNKLPEQLLQYWSLYGWCGYASGLFWSVNPQDYDQLLDHWLATTPLHQRDSYHVIARSAFGILYVWGETSGYCLTLNSYISRYSGRTSIFTGNKINFGVRAFFSSMIAEYNDLDNLFKPALKSLGPLKSDEMYGFV
ncbi:GAD-like domain-containing protein, partial [Pseudomonas syringae]